MIRVAGRLACRTVAEALRVRAALPDHTRLTRAEPGCHSFDVTPTDDPLVWRVEETFADQAALDAHRARMAGTAWDIATAGIPRHYVITG